MYFANVETLEVLVCIMSDMVVNSSIVVVFVDLINVKSLSFHE